MKIKTNESIIQLVAEDNLYIVNKLEPLTNRIYYKQVNIIEGFDQTDFYEINEEQMNQEIKEAEIQSQIARENLHQSMSTHLLF